ncbi:hypothetical protein [Oerskovia enterophila]|uniref:hypothetical protein n=1 Tax=Oerskovia enterophila TaxID=43678 RepID=UPI0037F1EFD3
MDISATLVGKSDQLDNIDLLSGPRDFTITDVSAGNAEQPINITLAEFPRPWRPGLTMRRVLAAVWGPDASVYVGRRVRLYRDPGVTFGKDATGGTRLSHASHIEKRVEITLPTSRGKFGLFKVAPLPDAPPVDVGAITDQNELRDLWNTRPDLRDAITARVNELKEQP